MSLTPQKALGFAIRFARKDPEPNRAMAVVRRGPLLTNLSSERELFVMLELKSFETGSERLLCFELKS